MSLGHRVERVKKIDIFHIIKRMNHSTMCSFSGAVDCRAFLLLQFIYIKPKLKPF